MTRHSKNNCAGSVFTYHEKLAMTAASIANRSREYSEKITATMDARKPLDRCFMCMARAVDPVCCREGHVGCRECFLNSLLEQKRKKDVPKHPEHTDGATEEEERNKRREFLEQQKLISTTSTHTSENKLPFWVPTEIKAATVKKAQAGKERCREACCLGGPTPHRLRLRELIAVKMRTIDQVLECFSCCQQLVSEAIVVLPCGHFVCKECRPTDENCCCACNADVSETIQINTIV